MEEVEEEVGGGGFVRWDHSKNTESLLVVAVHISEPSQLGR